MHEFRLEFKNRQALTGLLLYSIASIFIIWLSYRHSPELTTWNAIFWIIMLFAATNAVARSFLQESKGLQLFNYILFRPSHLILSKTVFNFFILLILGFINLLTFTLFFGIPFQNIPGFIICMAEGAFGLSAVLTLVSAIASRAQGNASLVAILGFPLLFPLLMILVRLSSDIIQQSSNGADGSALLTLSAFNLIIVTLSYLLFPYLWRE